MTGGHAALSLALGALPLKSLSLGGGGGCHRTDPSSSTQKEKKPQEASEGHQAMASLSSGRGPPWLLTDSALLIFLLPAWTALELSREAVGQRGVSRGQPGSAGGSLSLAEMWGSCLSPIRQAQPRITAPLSPVLSLSFPSLATICPDIHHLTTHSWWLPFVPELPPFAHDLFPCVLLPSPCLNASSATACPPHHQPSTRPTCLPCRHAAHWGPAQTPGSPESQAAAGEAAALAPWRPVQPEGLV